MLRKLVYAVIPFTLQKRLYHMRKNIRYFGTKRYCPACQRRSSRFLDFDLSPFHGDNGIVPPIVVPDTLCPWCGSHVHHRLMWTVLPNILKNITSSPNKDAPRILHFAPEKPSIPRLQKLHNAQYITTDFIRGDIHVKFDMCKMGLASQSIDLVIASHVLEHVPNDIAALNEIFRILRLGGQAVLLVPLLAESSYEYDGVTTDAERLRVYGQRDHVRAYGVDLADRIARCGFDVEVVRARDFPDLNRPSYLLDVQGILFLARKPVNSVVSHVQA